MKSVRPYLLIIQMILISASFKNVGIFKGFFPSSLLTRSSTLPRSPYSSYFSLESQLSEHSRAHCRFAMSQDRVKLLLEMWSVKSTVISAQVKNHILSHLSCGSFNCGLQAIPQNKCVPWIEHTVCTNQSY